MAPKRPTDHSQSQRPLKTAKKSCAKLPPAEEEYGGLWGTKFMEKEWIARSRFAPANLRNAVHAVFANNRFKKSQVTYDIIRPSARLATHLLQLDVLRPLIWTIIERGRPPQPIGGRDSNGRPKIGYDAVDCKSCPNDKAIDPDEIDAALQDLAYLVKYELADVEQGLTTQMRTRYEFDRWSDPRGSRIQISRQLYNRLRDASAASDTPDLALRLALQFQLAVTLVHEVFHALVNAVEGPLQTEPFLWDATIAEMGFEAEAKLFGGLKEQHFLHEHSEDETADPKPILLHSYIGEHRQSHLAGISILLGYPNHSIIDRYSGGAHFMSTRNVGRLPENDLGWRVKMSWVKKLFQNSYWQGLTTQQRRKGLIPPRDVGQFFNPGENTLEEVEPTVTRIPNGYRIATDGLNIVRETRTKVNVRGMNGNNTRSQTKGTKKARRKRKG